MAKFYPGYTVKILAREDWPSNIALGPMFEGLEYPLDTIGTMLDTYGDNELYTVKAVKFRPMGTIRIRSDENSVILCLLSNGFWYVSDALSIVDDTTDVPFTPGDIVYSPEEPGNIEAYRVTCVDYNESSITSLQSDSWMGRYHEDLAFFEGDITNLPKIYQCQRCGTHYSLSAEERENIYPEDRCLCPTCRRRRYVASYNCFKPHLDFYGRNGKEDFKYEGLYLGTEVEMAGGGESNPNAAKIMDRWEELGLDNFVYITHDGSLKTTGEYVDGFEMVTKPATLEFHKKIAEEYKNIFKLSTSMGYRAHDTSCCGLHVHINRGFFGCREETAILNMLYLFDKYWNEIRIFSRRDSLSLSRYARRVSLDWDDDAYFEHFNQNEDDHDGHYYSINICNPNTIEIRVFKGTLNFNTYLLTLEFVANLAKICKDTRRIETVAFEDLLSPEGLEYYNGRLLSQKYEAEN